MSVWSLCPIQRLPLSPSSEVDVMWYVHMLYLDTTLLDIPVQTTWGMVGRVTWSEASRSSGFMLPVLVMFLSSLTSFIIYMTVYCECFRWNSISLLKTLGMQLELSYLLNWVVLVAWHSSQCCGVVEVYSMHCLIAVIIYLDSVFVCGLWHQE
jgi:hypothetical protein